MNISNNSELGTIGLVGLGAMGRGVAANLAKNGFRVFGCDVREESRAALAGTDAFSTRAGELGPVCDVIVSFVVDHAQTEDVLFGKDGAAPRMRPGSIFVMCSTVPPAYARQLGGRLAERGIALIDAPVTGGAAGAASGGRCEGAHVREQSFAAAHGEFGQLRGREVRVDVARVGDAEPRSIDTGRVAAVRRCHPFLRAPVSRVV